jgi:surfactin synthase thioesterase subunit
MRPPRALRAFHRLSAPRLRLICFPFAGGVASIFRDWARPLLAAGIELHVVCLPGRETRVAEPFTTRVAELMEDLGPALQPLLADPLALYGHSMGGTLAFETAHWLRARHGVSPLRILTSATAAPHKTNTGDYLDLDDTALLDRVASYWNTLPNARRADRHLRSLAVAMIRADLTLLNDTARRYSQPLHCPIAVFGGTEDDIPIENLTGWRAHTTGEVDVEMLPGGHMFVFGTSGARLQQRIVSLLLAESYAEADATRPALANEEP